MSARASDADRAATYLISHLAERFGTRHRQGFRKPPLPCASEAPNVRRFAEERFVQVPDIAVQALIAWGEGHSVDLLVTIPTPAHVLSLQARGARCVSLLPPGVRTPYHEGGVDFALHDLCHLGKFACSEFYAEQVGFFAAMKRVLDSEPWRRIERKLDEQWVADRDHVAADMNGSCVFLFAALKMKLKMAARRLSARERGTAPRVEGPLDALEESTFSALLAPLLDAFELAGPLREAALGTSTRRDSPELATRLVHHFAALGHAVLDAQTGAHPGFGQGGSGSATMP